MSDDKKAPIELTSEEEHACYVFTLLLVTINPDIDEQLTYDLLAEAIHQGLNEDTVLLYGHLIRSTATPGTTLTRH